MSDFGSLITLGKGSTKSLDQGQKANFLGALNEAISEGEYSILIKERQYEEFVEWEDDTLSIMLTEYYDDEDRDDIWEFAEEEDIAQAEEIIEAVNAKLDEPIDMKAIFTEW